MRHQYFSAKTRIEKLTYQKKDKELLKKIAELLVNGGWGNASAHHVVGFDPYDQNTSASFFDIEWMFGFTEGFDVVIGNPPYKVVTNEEKKNYGFYQTSSCNDLYAFFYEKSIGNLLKQKGVISLITASLFIKGLKFSTLRNYLEKNTKLIYLKLQGDEVFEHVQMPTVVFISEKVKSKNLSFEKLDKNYTILKQIENPRY